MQTNKLYVYHWDNDSYGSKVFDIYDPPLNNISPNQYERLMKLYGVSFKYT